MHWKDFEYFDESWKERIALMAKFIPVNSSVVDLGCGKEWLKEHLDPEKYTGVDYKQRSSQTVIADFAKKEFPKLKSDVIFVSGCLEYVKDYKWFIGKICSSGERCILSYCSLETHPDMDGRRTAGWVNDLKIQDITEEFAKHGFALSAQTSTITMNSILVFDNVSMK